MLRTRVEIRLDPGYLSFFSSHQSRQVQQHRSMQEQTPKSHTSKILHLSLNLASKARLAEVPAKASSFSTQDWKNIRASQPQITVCRLPVIRSLAQEAVHVCRHLSVPAVDSSEELQEIWFNVQRISRGCIAVNRLTFLVNNELREVPFDGIR